MKNILIKTYGDRRTVWVSVQHIMRGCGASGDYIHKVKSIYKKSVCVHQQGFDVLPVTGESWRWGVIEGNVYFDLDYVPNNAPKCYRDKIGSRDGFISAWQQNDLNEDDKKVIKERILAGVERYKNNRYTEHYMYASEKAFTQEKAEKMAVFFSWIKFLLDVRSKEGHILLGVAKKDDFLEMAVEVLKEQGFKVSCKRVLRRRLMDFPMHSELEQQLEYMIHGSVNNQNSRIVNKVLLVNEETGEVMEYDVHLSLMFMFYANVSHANRLRKTYAYDLYKSAINRVGMDAISTSTFNRHTNAFYNRALMSKEREGFKAYNDAFNPYVSCYKLEKGNSLWVGDGSGSKLAYNDNGKMRTLYLVRIFDVASSKVMGFDIGDKETSEMVKEALKRALNEADNKPALEFLSDNGPAFSNGEMKDLLKMIFPKVRNIAVGNSQENQAETLTRLMTEYSRNQYNWLYTGFNSHFNGNNKANPDYIDVKMLPNKDEAYKQLEQLIKDWNNQKGIDDLSPNERYKNNLHEKATVMNEKAYRYVFGMAAMLDISYMRGIVKTTYAGKLYEYDIPDYAASIEKITLATGMKGDAQVMIKHDGVYADIYSTEGAYIMTIKKMYKAHKAEAEATDLTHAALTNLLKKKKAFVDKADVVIENIKNAVETIEANYGGDIIPYDMMAKGKRKEAWNETVELAIQEDIQVKQRVKIKDAGQAAIDNI